jgi:hypothetical protein
MAGVYVQARVQLKYGKLAAFNDTMARLVPIFEQRGWKLIGAWSTIVGDLHEVIDIWEVQDANTIGEAMMSASEDEAFQLIAAELPDEINVEVLSTMIKTPYSP